MAGQWFALPKLFNASKNEGYEIVKNDKDLIQFKNEQSWTFKLIPKTATINALVSLSLDPATVDSDFIQIKYYKDQAMTRTTRTRELGSRSRVSIFPSSLLQMHIANPCSYRVASRQRREEHG
jgi:hypothetical protein